MQPLRFNEVYNTAMVHSFEKYKVDHWTGIIQRPVDCLDILYNIDGVNLVEVKFLLVHKQQNVPKTYQALFDGPIQALDKVLLSTDRARHLDRLNKLSLLWQEVKHNIS